MSLHSAPPAGRSGNTDLSAVNEPAAKRHKPDADLEVASGTSAGTAIGKDATAVQLDPIFYRVQKIQDALDLSTQMKGSSVQTLKQVCPPAFASCNGERDLVETTHLGMIHSQLCCIQATMHTILSRRNVLRTETERQQTELDSATAKAKRALVTAGESLEAASERRKTAFQDLTKSRENLDKWEKNAQPALLEYTDACRKCEEAEEQFQHLEVLRDQVDEETGLDCTGVDGERPFPLKKRKQSIPFVEKLLADMGMDDSLKAVAPQALLKDPKDRGIFDNTAVVNIQSEYGLYKEKLEKKVTLARPQKRQNEERIEQMKAVVANRLQVHEEAESVVSTKVHERDAAKAEHDQCAKRARDNQKQLDSCEAECEDAVNEHDLAREALEYIKELTERKSDADLAAASAASFTSAMAAANAGSADKKAAAAAAEAEADADADAILEGEDEDMDDEEGDDDDMDVDA